MTNIGHWPLPGTEAKPAVANDANPDALKADRALVEEALAQHSKNVDEIEFLEEEELNERAALSAIFEEARDLHFKKREDYSRGGKDGGDDLGAAGQYAELHRKDGKLRRALWEGKELTGEQPREVLLDMIGHAVKAIRYLDTGNDR